jgi:hypothetical protein
MGLDKTKWKLTRPKKVLPISMLVIIKTRFMHNFGTFMICHHVNFIFYLRWFGNYHHQTKYEISLGFYVASFNKNDVKKQDIYIFFFFYSVPIG